MRIYISGPITGTKDFMERFAEVEENGQCEKENDLSVVWSDNGKGGGRQRKGTT